MSMTPQLQQLKAEYIASVNAISDEQIRRLYLPHGDNFYVEHKFYRHRGEWRVSLCMMTDKYNWSTICHCGDYRDRDEALRETYRLNGWGEPKPRKCQ